ncbi:MAG: HPr family phosphocarrier protein [Methylophilaceae bacterium]|jgi:phosphocarrier protein
MIKKELKIINELGLHARASSKLTQLACKFSSEIIIKKDKNKVNAKSMMEILMLAANKNSFIKIEIDGVDEKKALVAIEDLINNYFGESK